MSVPPLDPIEASALDPFDDPARVIDRLAWLCEQPATFGPPVVLVPNTRDGRPADGYPIR